MSDKELLIREMMQSFKAGNYRLTIELVNKIINMGVEDYRVYMLGGQTYFILQELDDAIFYLKRADKLSGSNNGEALFALGNCYFAKQQFDDAISVFSEAEKAGVSKATKAKVQYMLGLLHKQKGEYTKALDNYEKARRIDGENEDYEKILLDEAEIHFNRRDFVKAEEIVRKLILLRPAEYKCYKLLFQILVAQKKFNEANEVLVEAFKVCGNIDDIRIELGFDRVWMFCICSSLYKGTTKRDYLEKALKELDIVCKEKLKEEDKYEVLLTRAQIYLELEEYKKAVECLDGIEKEENPDFYEYIEKGYYMNIQCYSMLGEYKKADEYIVKLKNSNNKIYQFFAIYKEAYLLKKSGDEEFVEKYNEIIAFFRNEAAQSLGEIGYLATMYRAKCYIDIGKYEKAKETSELLPDDMKEDVINYINESMKR